MSDGPLREELASLLAVRQGHFRLESGHHGGLWLDLDLLFLRPSGLRRFAAELAKRLSRHRIDAVCGPLVGGALLAQMVASELDVEFYHAERKAHPRNDATNFVEYRIPDALRPRMRGRAVAVVDDVINAGSAIRATVADVLDYGAKPAALGALLVLGESAAGFAADVNIPLECLAHRPSGLWTPADCPLCAAGVPLEDLIGDRL
jgi:orotate phosphoribosyltransferase